MKEIFMDVVGYEGFYKVSNLGRVKSLKRKVNCCGNGVRIVKGNILKNSLNNNGYYRVNLRSNKNKPKTFLVHRLVCLSFLDNEQNKRTVNHINGIKTDNRLENLEWATDKENITHSINVLRNTNHFSKRLIKNMDTNEIYLGLEEVSKITKYSKPHLCSMLNGNYKNKTRFIYIE